MIWMFLLLPVVALLGLGIIYAEDAYYRRHPEKNRPEGSMYP